jgi:hypothetical protein
MLPCDLEKNVCEGKSQNLQGMDWDDRFYVKLLSDEDVSGTIIDIFIN